MLPVFESGEGGPYLCPDHFAEARAGWKQLNYNPFWLEHHPARATWNTEMS